MSVLQGLTTMVMTADDVDAACSWYAQVIGIEPYFRQPAQGPAAYVEFRVGPDEDELGIMNRTYAPEGSAGHGSSITYWCVGDLAEALNQLIDLGATEHTPVVHRGGGFMTASVCDPFGNVIGLMRSPHWTAQH